LLVCVCIHHVRSSHCVKTHLTVSLSPVVESLCYSNSEICRPSYFAPRRGATYCDQHVCLSARIYQKPHAQTSRNSQYMLPVAVARSPFDNSAIRCILPVLWMTSCVHVVGDMWCTARLTAEGCQSAGCNAERCGAEALKLLPSLRCLPLTDIPRP